MVTCAYDPSSTGDIYRRIVVQGKNMRHHLKYRTGVMVQVQSTCLANPEVKPQYKRYERKEEKN
jgi:hypothetical protein